MIGAWALDGVRPMIYMNPYVADLAAADPDLRTQYYVQGDQQGLFVKNPETDKTLNLRSISIKFAQIDFTNPDAVTWTKTIIK